jgi:serine/threonine-protein kinase HipA
LRELFLRIAFGILVSNTDDHLRNHGFLRSSGGWRLAPAYDLNPMPVDVRPRVHTLGLSDADDGSYSLDDLLSAARVFGMRDSEARGAANEVGMVVRKWRETAKQHGLGKRDRERMETAFEHEDLKTALRAFR